MTVILVFSFRSDARTRSAMGTAPATFHYLAGADAYDFQRCRLAVGWQYITRRGEPAPCLVRSTILAAALVVASRRATAICAVIWQSYPWELALAYSVSVR